ncbi:MAG: hydrogenase maturation protease [Verrucomicrobiota bacterium]
MSACAEPPFPTFEFLDDPSSLVYGIGNVGRRDDGLGWAFIDRLEARRPPSHAMLHRNYQLNFEDAELISRFARVLFVDATKDPAVSCFSLTRPEPMLDFSFTSHAISVQSILATARNCFGYVPEVYLLAIRGYDWELQMGLTEPAEQNLCDSLKYLDGAGTDQLGSMSGR